MKKHKLSSKLLNTICLCSSNRGNEKWMEWYKEISIKQNRVYVKSHWFHLGDKKHFFIKTLADYTASISDIESRHQQILIKNATRKDWERVATISLL